jgi:hypothetical protein
MGSLKLQYATNRSTGSIGNLASAATVAASSFDMKAVDPTMLIEQIDLERWNQLRQHKTKEYVGVTAIAYVEPAGRTEETSASPNSKGNESLRRKLSGSTSSNRIVGKVQILGDMVDTDAVSKT